MCGSDRSGRQTRYELTDRHLAHALTDLLEVVLAIDPTCPPAHLPTCPPSVRGAVTRRAPPAPTAARRSERDDHGEPSGAPVELTGQRRQELSRRAQRLASATVAYNTGEGLVAVLAGLAAGSVALVGFGLDSAVEVLSALAVSWQFSGRVDARARERTALRLIAVSFFALAAYVGVDTVRSLLNDGHADPSPVGIALAVASLLVMPLLVRAKRKVAASSARRPSAPTPPRPRSALTCPRSCSPGCCSTPPSAGPGQTRSSPWSSPRLRPAKACRPGTATPAAHPQAAAAPAQPAAAPAASAAASTDLHAGPDQAVTPGVDCAGGARSSPGAGHLELTQARAIVAARNHVPLIYRSAGMGQWELPEVSSARSGPRST